jgi:HAD superfamily hydrolase (TIGR01509 family)
VRSRTRAFIFDLDGVMAWTEPFHHVALNAFLKEFGCTLTPDQFMQLVGVDMPTVAELVTEWCSLPMSAEQVTEGRTRAVLPLLEKDLTAAPGLLALLDFLDQRGMSLAVASNSPRAYVDQVIALLGLSDRFQCVRADGDVLRGKPAPDVYLSASECLGIPSEDCVSVEDSPAGVQAAKASGMVSVLVPNGLLQDEDFPPADLCFASLTDLLDWLRSTFQADMPAG